LAGVIINNRFSFCNHIKPSGSLRDGFGLSVTEGGQLKPSGSLRDGFGLSVTGGEQIKPGPMVNVEFMSPA